MTTFFKLFLQKFEDKFNLLILSQFSSKNQEAIIYISIHNHDYKLSISFQKYFLMNIFSEYFDALSDDTNKKYSKVTMKQMFHQIK